MKEPKVERRSPRQITLSDSEVEKLDAVRAARFVMGYDSKMLTRSAVIRKLVDEAAETVRQSIVDDNIETAAMGLVEIGETAASLTPKGRRIAATVIEARRTKMLQLMSDSLSREDAAE